MENACCAPVSSISLHRYFLVIYEFSQTNKVDSFIMMTMVLYTTTQFINSIELLTQ